MKIISIVMTIIFVFSTLLLILTFRSPKKFSVRSQVMAILISLLSLVIFAALTKYQPSMWMWFLMGIIGLVIGVIQARTTKVYLKDNKVMSQNSVWYLTVWAVLFVINQLITTITNKPPNVSMAMLIVGTATTWGTNGDIIRRFYKVKASLPVQTEKQSTQITVPTKVAAKASKPEDDKTSSGGYCPRCGIRVQQDDEVCSSCGGKL